MRATPWTTQRRCREVQSRKTQRTDIASMRADTPGTAGERTSAVKGVLKAGNRERMRNALMRADTSRNNRERTSAASAEQRTERNRNVHESRHPRSA
jgi:hypothetical protein